MKTYFWALLGLLLFRTLWALGVHQFSGLDLVPDEAQYWTWAKALDWGYYSKPPGIAWQMAASTWVLGDTVLGVRMGGLLFNHGLVLATFILATRAGCQARTAFWAAALMGLSPLGFLGSVLATTDGGFVFFWTLAFGELALAWRQDREPLWWRLGLWVGLGALFKWPIYLLWLFAIPFCRSRKVFWGLVLSVAGLLPSLYWNISHDWATFRHVANTVQGGVSQGHPPPPNPLDFFGAQLGLIFPVTFAIWLWGLSRSVREWRRTPVALGLAAALLLGVYQALAFRQKMQGNWCVFVYPLVAVFVAWWYLEQERRRSKVLAFSLATSCVCMSLGLALPSLQARGWGRVSPFRQAEGWARLGSHLEALGYDPHRHFLAGEHYQEVSELSFYTPGQKRAVFFPLHPSRRNQFSYWPRPMESEGFFVLTAHEPGLNQSLVPHLPQFQRLLKHYFTEVECLGTFPLVANGDEVLKGACVFRCREFQGEFPEEGNLY